MVYSDILAVQSDLEASLDFIEDDLPASFAKDLLVRLAPAIDKFTKLISTWEEGHLLREGATVAIAGSPNVGKSTLVNAFLGKARAIVSDTPGTTRDIIEESYLLDGFLLRLTDTAGLRETDCVIEREGVDRAKTKIDSADIVIYMVDASRPLSVHDISTLATLLPSRTIVVKNKTDIADIADLSDTQHATIVKASIINNIGLAEIRRSVSDKLSLQHSDTPQAAISDRHLELLEKCESFIELAKHELSSGEEKAVLAASHIRDALESLAMILGKNYHEDLLDTIFSKFCIGK